MVATARHLRFLAVSALLFTGSAAITVAWSASMSGLGMPMPGGWTMSMMWMRMPGQTWVDAAASFLGMWVVMMAAMMLPSLVPALLRYRLAIEAAAGDRLERLTAAMGAGYFAVWTAVGLAVFPLGIALADVGMRQPALARAVPVATGLTIVAAGALQCTRWKTYHLACCRALSSRALVPIDVAGACRHGVRLGLHCSYSSAGLTALLVATGLMNLSVMAAVTTAATVERLAPAGDRLARATGAVIIAAGAVLILRAA